MLFFTIAWTGLILVCFLIGIGILNSVKADCFERIGDRFIIAVWLGLVILCVSLLAVSLILPLSPLVGAMVSVCIAAVAIRSHRTRTEIVAFRSVVSPGLIFGFLILELGIAALISRPITYGDTGGYHFQAIQWLSEFGVVPGLALIHDRFGFISSWFALAAPFNSGIFEARSLTATNGFAYLIATLHFLICLSRAFTNRAYFEDYFVINFSLISIFIITRYLMPIIVSPSPDLPVMIITIIISWAILVASKPLSSQIHTPILEGKIIPVILSAGALTIKMSALPLLLVSSLFYILGRRFVVRLIAASAIIALLVLPLFIFGVITSGCPLYPSSLMCLHLPWSLGSENAKEMSKIIREYAQWSGEVPSNPNSQLWLWHWFKHEKQAVLLLICSIISAVSILHISKPYQIRRQIWLLALGVLGIAFMMYAAPTTRFGLGYLALLPSLLLASYYNKLLFPFIHQHTSLFLNKNLSKVVLVFLLFFSGLVISIGYSFKTTPERKLLAAIERRDVSANPSEQSRWFLPPKMLSIQWLRQPGKEGSYPDAYEPSNLEVSRKKVNHVTILIPRSDSLAQCWAAELPCTPKLRENVKLRNPERGIRAGFIHGNLTEL
ncbi:LIC_10190 family membrane protein [Trichocoleus sp. FACHB-262]|uniref:LIC_10190 family membrane protein n=1 Tax=Trichocoleus sp. FACHB-262 TaxID=2692869 RepID=UPI00168412EF|nr:hypothetical protein [Trichocoleus sp. FACHB-262]MBD2123949.1 hypothetical protein [Trichocoleus sp. FACHB-262]